MKNSPEHWNCRCSMDDSRDGMHFDIFADGLPGTHRRLEYALQKSVHVETIEVYESVKLIHAVVLKLHLPTTMGFVQAFQQAKFCLDCAKPCGILGVVLIEPDLPAARKTIKSDDVESLVKKDSFS